MEILKKIWHWLSQDVTKGFQKSDEDFMLKDGAKGYNSGDYTKDNVNYVAPEEFYEAKGIRREGIKIKGGVNTPPTTPRPEFAPPPQNPTRDFKREADEHFRQQQARREADDNFLTGAMVGYVIADYLNNDNSHRATVEETKSNNFESSYVPSSSSSYDSGSYSSSSDSDSSSSSYDSGSYSSSSDSGSSSSCSCDSGC